ncbi:hypothetical protein H0H93_001724 [Arthromyces matolae]|nr:hypothetical protein H0H93_001724 [Arthromyces matolae]
MTTPGNPAKPTPFTPRRPPSSTSSRPSISSSNATTSSDLSSRLARTIPNLLASSKKYKAPLSAETRAKTYIKANLNKASLAPVPATPARPRTPGTPTRRGAESPLLMPPTSEMDVSNVNPEDVLVDSENIEPGDVSAEIDEAWLRTAAHDLVPFSVLALKTVHIRIRPTEGTSAWTPTTATSSIKLDPNYAKSSSTPVQSFNFDSILTGTPNKPIYSTVARSHVHAAMEGYNAVIFAYGQTASGKTFTLSGNEAEPGIIPRAMKDVFSFIRRTPTREYLLRCSYLEIYNEAIHDLLAPPSSAAKNPVQIQGGAGNDILLTPLREEVVTSLKGVKEVLQRGEGNRRTACTDWNERSSRSHSVFRMVIESRERGGSLPDDDDDDEKPATNNGRQTPGAGRNTPGPRSQTPGLGRSQTPGLPRLQSRGGRSVQTSVLSLIDLAGSEKATSDKERTKEGKYINTSLLTLGTVIGTLADNASKGKTDHIPYRNSKLTRMLQPSLSGNAREQIDESKAMKDLNSRIQQLTKLILTSQTLTGDDSRPASPIKLDFDMSPYQLQQELLSARLQIESQSTQILSLEASLDSRPPLPVDATDNDKDQLIQQQKQTIRELEIVVKGYESNLGEPLRQVKEDVEKEWQDKVAAEIKKREEKERWAEELVKQLDKEKTIRITLEEERRALAAFVSKFDSVGLGLTLPPSFGASKIRPPKPTPGGAAAAFAERRANQTAWKNAASNIENTDMLASLAESPIRMDITGGGLKLKAHTPLMLEQMPDEWSDISFEIIDAPVESDRKFGMRKGAISPVRELGDKENFVPATK